MVASSADSLLLAEIERMDVRRDTLAKSDLIVFEGQALSKLPQQAPSLWERILEVGHPVRVMVNIVEPHKDVPVHVDAGPRRDRRHLPLTVPVHIWDEEYGDRVFAVGEWSDLVPYWVPHRVWNPYDEPRVNVIVDFS